MSSDNGLLRGKRVVVLGASRGVGREIVRRASAEGAKVLAVARQARGLAELAKTTPGVDTLALDAASEDAPRKVFRKAKPDLLVICGGATPPVRPIPELTWAEFGVNWEVDAKMAFLFCREALRAPLAPGSVVVIISSGAGLGGSPISGGYAGAKRMQMFIAKYCQAESDRRELGIRFVALVPSRVMPETDLGQAAVNGYARYLGVPAEKFLENMGARQSPADVAEAVLDVAVKPPTERARSSPFQPMASPRRAEGEGVAMRDKTLVGSAGAAPPSRADFAGVAETHRRALKLHCYRMLGSLHEAEDAVQETMLRAWRGFDDFEARASIKNWLYRIATNVALNMVASRSKRGRMMPDQLGGPSTEKPQGRPDAEALWVEPYPDAELESLPDPCRRAGRPLRAARVRPSRVHRGDPATAAAPARRAAAGRRPGLVRDRGRRRARRLGRRR